MLKHLRATDNGFAKVRKDSISFPNMKRSFNETEKEDHKKFRKNEKGSQKICFEDTDDETLIRETQAALKSLSGNVSDTRSTLYKSNDNDEDYPNIFDVKESYQDYEISSNYNEALLQPASVKLLSHDIHEKLNNKRFGAEPLNGIQQKINMSAFKPILDGKKTEYRTPTYDNLPLFCKEASELQNFENNQVYKPIDSPDSKQYTILQPAGIGSRAASVLKDIVRDGILSVSAVSSTNGSVSDTVSSTTANDLHHEKENFQNKGNNPIVFLILLLFLLLLFLLRTRITLNVQELMIWL